MKQPCHTQSREKQYLISVSSNEVQVRLYSIRDKWFSSTTVTWTTHSKPNENCYLSGRHLTASQNEYATHTNLKHYVEKALQETSTPEDYERSYHERTPNTRLAEEQRAFGENLAKHRENEKRAEELQIEEASREEEVSREEDNTDEEDEESEKRC